MPSLKTSFSSGMECVLSFACMHIPMIKCPPIHAYITYQNRAARTLSPELLSSTFHCLFVVVAVAAVVVVGSYKFYRNLCAISWFYVCGRFECVYVYFEPPTLWKWKESKRTFNLEMQHWGIFTCNFGCSPFFSLFAELMLFLSLFVDSNFKTHFHYQLNTTRQIEEPFIVVGKKVKNKYSKISNRIVYLVSQCIWDSQIWCDIAVRPIINANGRICRKKNNFTFLSRLVVRFVFIVLLIFYSRGGFESTCDRKKLH